MRRVSKVHLSADGWCRPLMVTPGQRADCTRFEPVMETSVQPLRTLPLPSRGAHSAGPRITCREHIHHVMIFSAGQDSGVGLSPVDREVVDAQGDEPRRSKHPRW